MRGVRGVRGVVWCVLNLWPIQHNFSPGGESCLTLSVPGASTVHLLYSHPVRCYRSTGDEVDSDALVSLALI